MSNYQGIPSSFFMFCYGDSSKLNIPKAFAKNHEEFLQHGWLRLKTSSRRSWNVKIIKKWRTDEFQIKDGWSEFVNDNDLVIVVKMNFLTFRVVGPASLHVSIFREDSCLEEPPASPPSSPSIQQVQTWRIVKELKRYNISQRLEIPSLFMEGTGIAAKPTVRLRDDEGNEWEVTMKNRNMMKYSFTHGWSQFLNDNKLKSGDILLIEFVGDNIIEVVMIEEEAGRNLIGRARRGGLLNPYLVL